MASVHLYGKILKYYTTMAFIGKAIRLIKTT